MKNGNQVGPFMGVEFDKVISHGDRAFRIITYSAYNAMGLIGTEYNGVAILDDNEKVCLAKNIEARSASFGEVSRKQTAIAEEIASLSAPVFYAALEGWTSPNTHRLS
tara:strand:+ start:68 stop:391 length:324 start_codon:yes stop_codon:yes gene_type:complete